MTLINHNSINIGQEMYDFAASIFPFCRAITGDSVSNKSQRNKRGNNKTLALKLYSMNF